MNESVPDTDTLFRSMEARTVEEQVDLVRAWTAAATPEQRHATVNDPRFESWLSTNRSAIVKYELERLRVERQNAPARTAPRSWRTETSISDHDELFREMEGRPLVEQVVIARWWISNHPRSGWTGLRADPRWTPWLREAKDMLLEWRGPDTPEAREWGAKLLAASEKIGLPFVPTLF